MARFDVFPQVEDPDLLLLDVQADLLDGLGTRVVVPLMHPKDAPQPAQRLNPVLPLEDGPRVMVTQFLCTVQTSILGEPLVSLGDQSETIANALDMLTKGYHRNTAPDDSALKA